MNAKKKKKAEELIQELENYHRKLRDLNDKPTTTRNRQCCRLIYERLADLGKELRTLYGLRF